MPIDHQLLDASHSLMVWDDAGELPATACRVYSWNGYGEQPGVVPLLLYCELHAMRLRTKYLAWIYELGESHIKGKRIIDWLSFQDGLSYWWMTLLVEKSPYKSPISDAIRLIALAEIVDENKPSSVHLVSGNHKLKAAVAEMCSSRQVTFKYTHRGESIAPALNLRSFSRKLPKTIQALASFIRYVTARRAMKSTKKRDWLSGEHAVFICSYFFNISADLAKKREFHSRYWEGLHGLMRDLDIRCNWLQMYVAHDAVPDAKAAIDLANAFNKNPVHGDMHAFLESYLDWRIVCRVIVRWFGLNLIFWRLRTIENNQGLGKPTSYLWQLMREDWKNSLVGTYAFNNLVSIELFDAAMQDAPHQKKGFYLCENQSWERAFNHAWKKYGHGQLIAVPHSTVRFWDLRYYLDYRTFKSTQLHAIPSPDATALNGDAAIGAYKDAHYPEVEMVPCEALRFIYLNKRIFGGGTTKKKNEQVNVLVLGDYSPESTNKMVRLLEMALPYMTLAVSFTIKSHPGYMIDVLAHPALKFSINQAPLEDIMGNFDVAYSCNMTSAAVDAYLGGLPTVVMLDEKELNFSPLRGQSDVHFVSSAAELAMELESASLRLPTQVLNKGFFFLDPDMPRWKKLLLA